MSLQHIFSQVWSGSSGANQVSSTTKVTGTTEENSSGVALNAGIMGLALPYTLAYAALQSLEILSSQNVTWSVNLQIVTFTVTSANATVGATYTNNGATFTVLATISGGTTLYCSVTGNPLASGTLTKATGTGDATITFSAATSPAVPYYVFTVSSANATAGATYTNNGLTFTVLATISSGTQLLCSGPASVVSNGVYPTASGTLTKASGTGDATITFSAASYPSLVVPLLAGVPYTWINNGYFTNPFNANFTNFFFSNLGASAATINVRGLRS